MSDIVSKLARLAASKAAAFCYAVAVGVAGNLAFNFVQQHNHATSEAAATPPAAIRPAGSDLAPEPVQPQPKPQLPQSSRRPAASAAVPAIMSPVPQPANRPAAATASVELPPVPSAGLADPAPTMALPNSEALRVPPLKPAPLTPPREEAAAAKPAPPPPVAATAAANAHDDPIASLLSSWSAQKTPSGAATAAASPAATPTPAATPAGVPATTTAALPPLGPAVDVTAPPSPAGVAEKSRPAEPKIAVLRSSVSRKAEPPAAASERQQQQWQLSDLWHPGRVVRRGLHWAGDQLPSLGPDETKPPPFPWPGPGVPMPVSHAAAAPVPRESAPRDTPTRETPTRVTAARETAAGETAASGQPLRRAPISLLPMATTQAPAAEKTDAVAAPAKPSAPGPGSGGLY